MGKVSRVDRAIAVGLVAVLLVLLVLAVVHRSGPSRAATPVAASIPSPRSPHRVRADFRLGLGGRGLRRPVRADDFQLRADGVDSLGAARLGRVSAVGDSIMLDIEPYLQTDLPGVRVDGLVSRQFETGIAVVQAERAAGTLGRVLVVELGTNGTVTASDFDAMMQAAAGVSRVVFVNVDVPRSWEAPDNAVLAAGVARYPGAAVLADWYTLAAGHPEWFTADQVHLQPAGAQALADLVTQYA